MSVSRVFNASCNNRLKSLPQNATTRHAKLPRDAMTAARRNWCESITEAVASASTQRLQAPIPGCFRLPWDWRSAPFLLANPIRARGDFDGGWASGVRMDKALAPSGDGLHGDGVCRHEITSAIVTHPAREVLGNQIGVLVQTLDHGIGVPST